MLPKQPITFSVTVWPNKNATDFTDLKILTKDTFDLEQEGAEVG
jgi:hypothetical protein